MSPPTPAVAALVRAGLPHRLHQYQHDETVTAFGPEAAAALGIEKSRVFKTLVGTVGGELVVGVVPVAAQVDLKALAAALGAKRAEMADPVRAERATGYVLGAISPLGQRRHLATVLDLSASSWETIFCSGGRRGLEIELAPGDLLRATGGRVASIARWR